MRGQGECRFGQCIGYAVVLKERIMIHPAKGFVRGRSGRE